MKPTERYVANPRMEFPRWKAQWLSPLPLWKAEFDSARNDLDQTSIILTCSQKTWVYSKTIWMGHDVLTFVTVGTLPIQEPVNILKVLSLLLPPVFQGQKVSPGSDTNWRASWYSSPITLFISPQSSGHVWTGIDAFIFSERDLVHICQSHLKIWTSTWRQARIFVSKNDLSVSKKLRQTHEPWPHPVIN